MTVDAKLHSPAADRNGAPILEVLTRCVPATATVLEVASGTGQHAALMAARRPGWTWQPTDAEPQALASIAAWCAGLPNVRPPLALDLLDGGDPAAWPGLPGSVVDAVFCANLLHIAPWAVCAALMRVAASRLGPRGVLVVYGPFLVDGVATSPGNLAFDADLRARDPRWGLRRLADVQAEAAAAGFGPAERIAMPANNLSLVWRRRV